MQFVRGKVYRRRTKENDGVYTLLLSTALTISQKKNISKKNKQRKRKNIRKRQKKRKSLSHLEKKEPLHMQFGYSPSQSQPKKSKKKLTRIGNTIQAIQIPYAVLNSP